MDANEPVSLSFSDGVYDLSLKATDKAGNIGSKTRLVGVYTLDHDIKNSILRGCLFS